MAVVEALHIRLPKVLERMLGAESRPSRHQGLAAMNDGACLAQFTRHPIREDAHREILGEATH